MFDKSVGSPDQPVDNPTQNSSVDTLSPRGHDILIVDDEVLMRSLIEKYVKSAAILKGQGPRIHQRESGWDLLEQNLKDIRVAVVDILLPRVTGVDLIRDLRRRYPEMGIVAVTGMATEPMKRAILELIPESQLLLKPLRKDIFSQAFQTAWIETLPLMPQPELISKEDSEDYLVATEVELQTTVVPVVRRRLGRKTPMVS